MALEKYKCKAQTFTFRARHYDVRHLTDAQAAQLLAQGCSLIEKLPDTKPADAKPKPEQ